MLIEFYAKDSALSENLSTNEPFTQYPGADMTSGSTNKRHKASPLSRLYARQQPKVVNNQRQGKLLKTFAEDDLKKIATLIKTWLNEDEKARKIQEQRAHAVSQ